MPFPFDPNLRIFNTTSRFFFFSFAFSETFFPCCLTLVRGFDMTF